MKRLALVIAAQAVALAACGQGPAGPSATKGTAATPLPSTSASAAQASLFAVLEARHCKSPEPAACEAVTTAVHDTIAIAGQDGYAKAKTTFPPRILPILGNAAPVLELEGQVAAGAVYVVNGKGAVRRMTPDGAVSVVATFPITGPQQEVSFAVSPDGKQLMAAVLTLPTHHNDPNTPFGTFTGSFGLRLELAAAGGNSSVVAHWESVTNQEPNQPGGFTNIDVVSWDNQGPIALVGGATGTQNAIFNNQHWFGGHLARLHLDGTLGPAIGPSGCAPYWRPSNGRFVCTGSVGDARVGTPVKAVSLDGTVLWSGTAAPIGSAQPPGDFALSADGFWLAMDNEVVNLKDGSIIHIPENFWPEGWLGAGTLIGLIPSPHTAGTLGILRLSDVAHPENWGFSGAYVGPVA